MRGPIVSLGTCLLIFFLSGCGPKSGDAKKDEDKPKEDPPEVKWAQKVAEEFLETLVLQDVTQQKSLTTKAFQANHGQAGVFAMHPAVQLKSSSVTEKTMAPGGQEVILKGKAEFSSFENGENIPRPGDWTVNVVLDNGRWLVNYCRIAVDATRRVDQAAYDERERQKRREAEKMFDKSREKDR